MADLHSELYKSNLREGDRILLCTDGLSDMLEDDQIAAIIRDTSSSEQACEELVEAAKLAGGRDNITVAICERHVQNNFI